MASGVVVKEEKLERDKEKNYSSKKKKRPMDIGAHVVFSC